MISSAELLVAHSAILAAAVAGYYKYGDRTEYFRKSFQGLKNLQEALKSEISEHLKAWIAPVLRESSTSIASSVLDSSGNFHQSFADPLEGESYKNAAALFLQGNLDSIIDYRILCSAATKWSFWARLQSWVFVASFISEGVICAILFTTKLLAISVTVRLLEATSVPTVACFALFCLCAVRLSMLHDSFLGLTRKHAIP